MFVRELNECKEIIAGDATKLREIFNPLSDGNLQLRYSLAHARMEPGKTSLPHKLKTSEVYYILQGTAVMHIDGEDRDLQENDTVYIPPHAVQSITNSGVDELVFICMVDPAWCPEDEEVLT